MRASGKGACLVLVLCAAGLASGCDNNRLSDRSVKNLVQEVLKMKPSVTYCMNNAKIKSYRNPKLLENVGERGFPVVFAEEAFLQWTAVDQLIATVLVGEGMIAVHRGGYEDSVGTKGRPGDVYNINSYDQAAAMFNDIRQYGAVVDLTQSGEAAHAWSQDKGFCVTGRWNLNEVKSWTEPAPDSNGRIVTHITVELKYHADQAGAVAVRNPFDATLLEEREAIAVKYGNGWKIDNIATE